MRDEMGHIWAFEITIHGQPFVGWHLLVRKALALVKPAVGEVDWGKSIGSDVAYSVEGTTLTDAGRLLEPRWIGLRGFPPAGQAGMPPAFLLFYLHDHGVEAEITSRTLYCTRAMQRIHNTLCT